LVAVTRARQQGRGKSSGGGASTGLYWWLGWGAGGGKAANDDSRSSSSLAAPLTALGEREKLRNKIMFARFAFLLECVSSFLEHINIWLTI